jgi:transposase
MYPRIVKAAGSKGQQVQYVRLVEAFREEGRVKQRTVCNLGRRDVLAAHLDAIVAVVRGDKRSVHIGAEDVNAIGAWDWGPVLVTWHLWRELGLEVILDRLEGHQRARHVSLSDRAVGLVANRLCEPASEHGLAGWLESTFLCDRTGRRWAPRWRSEEDRRHSLTPRVRVASGWLAHWYRALDGLVEHKAAIERELFVRLRDLLSLQVDLVFYDLTSTYFEGRGPDGLAAHGHSRDGRPRNRQVLVGVVVVDGWPIAHHVFAGNWRDAKTVPTVLDDLASRFGLRRVVFVGDRGMVTTTNLDVVKARGQGYVVGLHRRNREEVVQFVQRATGPWQECPFGITTCEKDRPPRTLVQEVDTGQSGVRVFVAHSEEREQFERARRLQAMERVRDEMEALWRRVQAGKLKAAAKVGAAAARILTRNHGHRYYDWRYQDGQFGFFEHPVNLAREVALEGKYIIQTEEANLAPVEAVSIYKQLSDVERAFACLKDVIELRPIYHHAPQRVEGHIFVAHLALVIHRALEKKLKAARLDLSASQALRALKTVRVVDIVRADGSIKRSVTPGSADAARVLRAVGVDQLQPPTPKNGPEEVL